MDSDLSYWLVLISCLILSAIFSAAETALTTVPETYIRKIIDEKHGYIKPFILWLERPNRILTAIIIGSNIVNTLVAVVATIYAQKIFHDHVITIATTLVTLALIIFGEITPKTFARHNARSIVRVLIYFIYPLYFILFPAVWLLTHFAVFLVQALGGSTKRTGPVATEEDIEYLIRLSHEEGVFKQEQGKMLQSVMSFRDTVAREIMVPRTELCSLSLTANLAEILAQVSEHGYTRWPVYTDDIDHVVGVFYVKDLISFQVAGRASFSLKEHLRKAIFIPESMKLNAVLREFQRQKVHLAIVVDEYGGTAGIVSLEDILEEIVGEIHDEYDQEEEGPIVQKVADQHFLADGRVAISDLAKYSGVSLPADEAYETLSGFLVSHFGKIPKKNAVFVYAGWRFRAVEVEEKRVVRVEITKAVAGD